jgi:hypothetical protein
VETETDAKSAIITVGGTVAGGLLLVLSGGLALELSRGIVASHQQGQFAILTLVKFIVIPTSTYVMHRHWRGHPPDTIYRLTVQLMFACGAFVFLLLLLTYVGIAAGVK